MQVQFRWCCLHTAALSCGTLVGVPSASSPTLLRRQLGAELRRLRERTARTVADVAGALDWSESKLSRVETAAIGIRTADLHRLLDLYAVAEEVRTRLVAIAGQSRQRAWWEAYGDVLPGAYETYIGFEAEARSIFTYEAQVVPGLLQTTEYAQAVLDSDGEDLRQEIISQRVQVRMARQAVLTRVPVPDYWAVLDEDVLRRSIGGPDVHRRQLLRLAEMSERPNITLQILPFSVGAHRGLSGSFIVLEFADEAGGESLVYCEGLTGGVFRNKPAELRRYWMAFESLRAISLSPRDSVALVRSVAEGQ
jgi:transcriptional regulator with XRE-family HTH domain